MKQLELKNQMALDIAKLVFSAKIDCLFIGGTALNTFYLDYRYSEDVDFGYTGKNIRTEITEILKASGYKVARTNYDFRFIVGLQGNSIKMDIIEYDSKGQGIRDALLGDVKIQTLSPEEFMLDKAICFASREEFNGLVKDAYDLFMLDQKFGNVIKTIRKHNKLIRSKVNVVEYNITRFLDHQKDIESEISHFLKKEVKTKKVGLFIKSFRKVFE